VCNLKEISNIMDSILIKHTNHEIYFSLAKENLAHAEICNGEILESGLVIPHLYGYILRESNPEKISWLDCKRFELKKFIVSSIIFSALTIEAFINYYAISKGMSMNDIKYEFKTTNYKIEPMSNDEIRQQFSLPYEQRTTVKKWIKVDKKDIEGEFISETVVKWIEIPLQYTGKYIPSGQNGNLIYSLNKLFNLRNNLVHHKAKVVNLAEVASNLSSEEDENYAKKLKDELEDKNYVELQEAEGAFDIVVKAVKSLQQIDNNVDITWLSS
jgi:hypothetical protein